VTNSLAAYEVGVQLRNGWETLRSRCGSTNQGTVHFI